MWVRRDMPNVIATAEPASTLDLEDLKHRLQDAYPSATERLLDEAISASLIELNGDTEPGKLIRCVCERITA